MYSNQDERFEVSDFDEDIQLREALIEEAKKIPETAQWNEVSREITNLKRKWRQISYWESAYEDSLEETFDGYLDVFYAKRREGLQGSQKIKEDLIEQANTLVNMENLNQATNEMNDLMNQWKESGSAGKEIDDTLWESFSAARQAFYDRKHAHWETMKSKFANAREVKENLIEQVKTLETSEEWKKTGEVLRTLLADWKAVGSAGKEFEDRLWNEFNESRQKFYERRDAYYDSMREQQNENYDKKKALVEKAQTIATTKEYTRENTQQMKTLGEDWKKIESCGKDKEDTIWKEFRSFMDAYFAGLKQWNEQRQLQWRQRLLDVRSRKQELIQDQKRQIKYMESEIVGLIGERAIEEMKEDIKDKEAFIQELEAELIDIDEKLSK